MRKRNPRRVVRPILKPLGVKCEVTLELPARIAVEALGRDWLGMAQLRDIGGMAMLCERVARAVGDQFALAEALELVGICIAVENRHEATGKAGVSGEQMQGIRDALEKLLPWINRQPNATIYRESAELLKQHDALRKAHERASVTKLPPAPDMNERTKTAPGNRPSWRPDNSRQ